ncbi:hypothetical protein ES332_A10G259300v1 [Gossypium tomentosum]|uniref:Phorbol-ester/DAG-type domain-containing protein n=1 Tax=Gossypium tomentosum TaxID=34277 RepID=A0A5D2NZW9_GOSTO|nr:hypothetical protein ES332_A10G259300v1 [Gossypium tomentosum]
MEVLPHFSHVHPLVFNDGRSHKSEEVYCCACGELVLGPRFSCVDCGFHLDKNCAEAPVEMNHPFHRKHNLKLMTSSPYVEDLVHQDKPISSECHYQELERVQCFACQKPLLESDYISHESRFYLHKKCFELPLEISHLSHRCHSLFLQFNNDHLPCQICQETQHQGLVYCCLICKFVLHIECVSPPPIIEDPSIHEHPFTRCLRELSFNCDACGTLGNYVSYNCSTCSLMVHKKCISLPRFIKSVLHDHPISHKYFVVDNECTTHDCLNCHEEVNMACGSYNCSKCKFIIHVNCALQKAQWYYKIESKDDFDKLLKELLEVGTMNPSFSIRKMIKVGEKMINIEIEHFSHHHNLVLSDEVKERRYCDGCSRLILTSFYGCLECDFFLHKSCAELPKKKQIRGRFHQDPFVLTPSCIFICSFCRVLISGFAYKCEVYLCKEHFCVRCAEIPLSCMSGGHEHLLLLYREYCGQCCNACGGSTDGFSVYRCKACNFNVHYRCAYLLPQTTWHKSDRHGLILTYHEDNDYSQYHYCDVCEKERNLNTWFYHCPICDNSAHFSCVLRDDRFVKRRSKIKESDHPHILMFVEKVYDYPECHKCGDRCMDLALECLDAECKYIIHLKCSKTFQLLKNRRINSVALTVN